MQLAAVCVAQKLSCAGDARPHIRKWYTTNGVVKMFSIRGKAMQRGTGARSCRTDSKYDL